MYNIQLYAILFFERLSPVIYGVVDRCGTSVGFFVSSSLSHALITGTIKIKINNKHINFLFIQIPPFYNENILTQLFNKVNKMEIPGWHKCSDNFNYLSSFCIFRKFSSIVLFPRQAKGYLLNSSSGIELIRSSVTVSSLFCLKYSMSDIAMFRFIEHWS